MLFLPPRRLACALALSLLCLPALAEAPNPSPPAAAAPSAVYRWRSLVLKHIHSVDAVAALHWDTPTATLPAGVARIYALQSNNTLLLKATDAGLAEVTRLVQTVDLPTAAESMPPQVCLRVEFATVSTADVDNIGVAFDAAPPTAPGPKFLPQGRQLKIASGKSVAQLYQALTRRPGSVVVTPDAVTANDAFATFSINTQAFRPASNPIGPPPSQPEAVLLQASLKIVPRINADRSVTLLLMAENYASTGSSVVVNVPATGKVASGQMLMLAGLPPNLRKPADSQELLVFVTPTVLYADSTPTVPEPAPAPGVSAGQTPLPTPSLIAPPAVTKRYTTFEIYNPDIEQVAALLQRQMGIHITLQRGIKPFGIVRVHLTDATPSQVLQAVADSAGAVLTSEPGNRYVFSMPGDPVIVSPTIPPAPVARRIRLDTLLLGVPATRTDFTALAPPDALLEKLLQGACRVIQTPTVTAQENQDTISSFYYTPPPPAPTAMPAKKLLLISSEVLRPGLPPLPGDNVWNGHLGPASTFQVTPHFGDENVIALNLKIAGQTVRATHPVYLGQLAVVELPQSSAIPAERFFLFLRPTLLPPATDNKQGVTIIP